MGSSESSPAVAASQTPPQKSAPESASETFQKSAAEPAGETPQKSAPEPARETEAKPAGEEDGFFTRWGKYRAKGANYGAVPMM